ncbi:hypothetical protein T4E_8810, partial [Trichinella pseudospiralis]
LSAITFSFSQKTLLFLLYTVLLHSTHHGCCIALCHLPSTAEHAFCRFLDVLLPKRITSCSFLSGVTRTKIDAEAVKQNPPGGSLQVFLLTWRKRRRSKPQPATSSGRLLLLGGIWVQIRALWLKDRVQRGVLQITAAWLSESVQSCWRHNCVEPHKMGSVGREKTAVGQKESVKSRGQYWVGRDKIDCNLLEGTKYKGIEMRRNKAGGKAPLAYNVSGQWRGSGDLYIIPRNLNGSVHNCWEGNRTRPDKLERDLVLKNLLHCQKEEAAHVLTKRLHRCSESVVLWKTKYVNSTWDHNALYGSKVSEMWWENSRYVDKV